LTPLRPRGPTLATKSPRAQPQPGLGWGLPPGEGGRVIGRRRDGESGSCRRHIEPGSREECIMGVPIRVEAGQGTAAEAEEEHSRFAERALPSSWPIQGARRLPATPSRPPPSRGYRAMARTLQTTGVTSDRVPRLTAPPRAALRPRQELRRIAPEEKTTSPSLPPRSSV